MFGIGTVLNNAVASIILYFQGLVLGFVGTVLAETAKLFGLFLKAQGNYFKDVTIVQTSWTVFRDFANMFFILILVIIAFATIFDVQKYNWKGLIAKFLIAALLINFSLVIGQFIINVSTTLSNVMLNQFSDITGNLAGGFGLNALIGNANAARPTADADKLLISTIISFMGITIVTAIAMLSMLAAFVFSLVRVPILWALLIISPLAWISSILPNTRQLHQWWWKNFIGWVFFMPMYLFALVMGISILANRPDLDAAAKMSLGQTALSQAGNLFGFAAQDLFFYILTVIILVFGLAYSLKASFLAGTGVTKVFGGISGGINNYVKRKTGITGAQETWKRVKQEGLPEKWGPVSKLYTGARGAQKETAKWEQRLGGTLGYTPDLKRQKQQVGEINTELGRLKDLETAGQLKVDSNFATEAYKTDRNSTRGQAMRAFLYEKGMVDGAEDDKDMTAWLQTNSFLAQNMAERGNKGGNKKIPVDQLVGMAKAEGPIYSKYKTDAARSTRKTRYAFIKDDAKALSSTAFDSLAFNNGLDLYGGKDTPEGTDFIQSVAKVRPDLVANYNMTLPPIGGATPLTRAEHMEKLLKGDEDISKMPMIVWNDPDFTNALYNKISKLTIGRQRGQYKNRLNQLIKDNNFDPDLTNKLTTFALMP